MVAASAFRAKYRKCDAKVRVRIDAMGVHRGNRGGVYPAGIRAMRLATDVFSVGFDKEDFAHNCVAVEEAPVSVQVNRSSGSAPTSKQESASAYNARKCSQDVILVSCFNAPYDEVRHQLLSHNHMMLCIRAFLTRAQWDVPTIDDDDRHIVFCDSEGRLSTTAVAESPNGRELADVLRDGIYVDVLSYRMDEEEPNAAAIISEALNSSHQLAMASGEMSAVSALNGAIIEMNATHGQGIAYATARDKVRQQLPIMADDPDFPEVFEFLIHTGAGTNTYVQNLLDYAEKFVDAGKRRLRLSAFGVVNKLPMDAPWTKIAVVKRAYRGKPSAGYCASPGLEWTRVSQSRIQILEEILRFFHVSCMCMINTLSLPDQIKIQGNIDITSADTFHQTITKNPNSTDTQLRDSLLSATRRFVTELGMEADEVSLPPSPKCIDGRADWIAWGADKADAEVKPAVAVTPNVAPVVIEYDEVTGLPKNRQVDFSDVQKTRRTPIVLPWREWLDGAGGTMGELQADCATAVAGLHAVHAQVNVSAQPIDVHKLDGHCFVIANAKVNAGTIVLPPVVPKASKVLPISTHPHAIRLSIAVKRVCEKDETDSSDNTTARQRYVFVNPEFSPPIEAMGSPAVAGQDAAIEWQWNPKGTETMCPFWAVHRMTRKQLQAATTADCTYLERVGVRRRFNCELRPHVMTCINIGMTILGQGPVNMTRTLEVPFLVNTIELEDGEQLFLEIQEAAPKPEKPRGWKQAHHESEQASKKSKKHMEENDGNNKGSH